MKHIKSALLLFCLAAALLPQGLCANTRTETPQIRNVIMMIPDGCGSEWLAMGRWLNAGIPLHLDSIIKGMVKTYCSDSPIGDSAPTGSCYATGHRSQDGFVATYPARAMSPDGKRFDVPDSLAYRPMMTLLEAAKLQGKATAMVVTCFFTHATPADFTAHTPKRNEYFRIAKQITANPCDILLGGGSLYVDSSVSRYGFDARKRLENNHILYTKNFTEAQEQVAAGAQKIWGLFAPNDLEFEIDRRHTDQPSLEEMTRLALKAVGGNPEGFFMMVEGSKVDWAAHDNDLPGAAFDFLAFDRAVGAAVDFAVRDGHTLVLVMPDHQTGGVSLGNANHPKGYAQLSYEELFGKVLRYPKSVDKAVRDIVHATEHMQDGRTEALRLLTETSLRDDFFIDNATEEEVNRLAGVLERNGTRDSSVRTFTHTVNRYTSIGWTTYGHNGGDVFLGVYHPDPTRALKGIVDNEEIAPYVCREAGFPDLDSLSRLYYTPLEKVFAGKKISVKGLDGSRPGQDPLCVEIRNVDMKDGKKGTLTLYPNSTRALLGKMEIRLPSPCIYNGKGFYLLPTF